jgi:hypothetical protein
MLYYPTQMEAIELYYYILSIVKKRKGEEEKTGP